MKRSACLLAVAAALGAATSAPAQRAGCAANLAARLASTGSASQIVTVVGATASSTAGTMRLWQRRGGCWIAAPGPWSVYLGFAGISSHHSEGDGTTPAGAFGIGPMIYGVAPNPGVHYRYHRLACGDWWDEDPASSAYNSFQHVRCGSTPAFHGSSEALWRSTRAYQHFALVRYNVDPAVPGRGSAIFIHADLGHATNGCISLDPAHLVTLLRWLEPAAHPLIVIGTATGIASR